MFNWFKKNDKGRQDFVLLLEEVSSWEKGKAKAFALEILLDESKFETRENSSNIRLDGLKNELVNSIYQRYEFCRQIYGDAILDVKSVGKSKYRSDYIRVAYGIESVEIVISKDSDEVHEVDGSEYDFKEAPYPSIYHWLVYNSCLVYEDLATKILSSKYR